MSSHTKHWVFFYLLSASLLAVTVNSAVEWRTAARSAWFGMEVEHRTEIDGRNQTQHSYLQVRSVEPGTPASRSGIRHDDQITAINGDGRSLAGRLHSLPVGLSTVFTVNEKGKPSREVRAAGEAPFSRPRIWFFIAANLLMGLLSYLIGALVFWKRPGDVRACLLFAFTALFAVARLVSAGPGYVYATSLETNFVPVALYIASGFLFFPVLLHFCLVFPRRRPVMDRHPKLLRWIYGVPAVPLAGILAFIGLVTLISGSEAQEALKVVGAIKEVHRRLASVEIPLLAFALAVTVATLAYTVPRWRRDLSSVGLRAALLSAPGRSVATVLAAPLAFSAAIRLLSFAAPAWKWMDTAAIAGLVLPVAFLGIATALVPALLFPVAACVALWRSYRDAGVEEKRQLKWPAWALIFGVVLYLSTGPAVGALSLIFRWAADSQAAVVSFLVRETLPKAALLLIPLALAFAVMKHRLMDIDVYIRRTVVYAAVTIVLGAIYLLLVAGLGGLLTSFIRAPGTWVPIGSTLAVALAFVPIRNRVQSLVDRRFYRRHDYPAALRNLAARTAQVAGFSELLRAAVESICEAAHARSAAIWLAQGSPAELKLEAAVGVPSDAPAMLPGRFEALLHTPQSPPWDALDEAECIALKDTGAAYLAPLRKHDRLTGIIALGRKLSDAGYDAQDADFLAAAAAQVAAGLAELQARDERRDSERAREIQEALLPAALPQPAGFSVAGLWQPARYVGGDYYELMQLDEARFAFAIADVSGKGVSAALLMSNLQAAIKVLAYEVASPAAVCKRINRIICRNVNPGKFITLIYGVLDCSTRRIVYCNAGHNPPILSGPGKPARRLTAGGPLLGVLPDAGYEEEELEFFASDRLLLFTDGLSEACDAGGDDFGEERLAEILNRCVSDAAAIRDELLAEVSTFCRGEFSDDVTMLVLAAHATAAHAPR